MKNKIYFIYYCFLTKKGAVQTDNKGNELYYLEKVFAENEEEAKQKFYAMEQFANVKPEIKEII